MKTKVNHLIKQFNWRFLPVRILVNAIALAITAAITPKIYFVDKSVWNWMLMAITLGVLNALLKPLLQFLTLQFLFVTYGLVIVFVNTLILLLLSSLFPDRFAVDNLLWAIVGGLVLGILSSFLESLLGLTMPIVPDEPPELRHRLEEHVRQADWLATASSETRPEEQALALEPPVSGVKAAEPDMGELSAPGPDEGLSPPAEVEAEPSGAVAMPPAEEPISVDPELAPEPREEQEEDRS